MQRMLVWIGVCGWLVLRQAAGQEAAPPGPPLPAAPGGGDASAKPVLTPPSVHFSHDHAATNKLGVGEPFPNAALSDLAGQTISLAEAYGPRLTLVLVWSDQRVAGRTAYAALRPEFLRDRGPRGLAVIAVNRGDAIPVLQAAAEKHSQGILTLRDPEDLLWSQLATRKSPRLYLLDANGKILWMDIEFSAGTARDLNQALDYYLQRQPAGQVEPKAP